MLYPISGCGSRRHSERPDMPGSTFSTDESLRGKDHLAYPSQIVVQHGGSLSGAGQTYTSANSIGNGLKTPEKVADKQFHPPPANVKVKAPENPTVDSNGDDGWW